MKSKKQIKKSESKIISYRIELKGKGSIGIMRSPKEFFIIKDRDELKLTSEELELLKNIKFIKQIEEVK